MSRYLCCILVAALTVLVLFLVSVPCLATDGCDSPRYPRADFICRYPGSRPATPDGPPYTIECIDRSISSQPITSWQWEFGDGETSTEQSPRHTYAGHGRYEVRLAVSTACGRSYSDMAIDLVPIYCSIPLPGFTTSTMAGFAPLPVQVTDASQYTPAALTTWTYWFGDSHTTRARNPLYVFTTPGNYTINQTVRKECVEPGRALPPPYSVQIRVSPPPTLLYYLNTSTAGPTTRATPFALGPTYSLQPRNTSATAAATAGASLTEQGAPAASSGAGTGMLSVRTEPAGAMIYVDDVLAGASPAMIPGLAAGSHTLRLERAGYRAMVVPVTVDEGKTTEYSTALVPEAGGRTAASPGAATAVLSCAGAGMYLVLRGRKD